MIAAAAGLSLATRGDDDDASEPRTPTQVLGVQLTPAPAVPALPPDLAQRLQDALPRIAPPNAAPRTQTSTTTTTTVTTTTPVPVVPRSVTRPNPINCQDPSQRQFCTAQESMNVSGGALVNRASSQVAPDPSFPTFTLSSTPIRSDGQTAQPGDKVSSLRIKLQLVNGTPKNFIVPEGDLAVKMKRDGADVPLPVQKQGQFEMRPQARLQATYEIPVFEDGAYSWYGETFFYEA